MNTGQIRDRRDPWAGRLRALGRQVTARPLPSILTAVAIGFLTGLVLRMLETAEREK